MEALQFAIEKFATRCDTESDTIPQDLVQVLGFHFNEGYGHYGVAVVAIDGCYRWWAIEGSWCSYGGTTTVNGPFHSRREAIKQISEVYRNLLE